MADVHEVQEANDNPSSTDR